MSNNKLFSIILFVFCIGFSGSLISCNSKPSDEKNSSKKDTKPKKSPTSDDKTLVFGVYTSDKPTVMYRKFEPIIGYLQKQLQTQKFPLVIKIKVYPSYEKALNALVEGKCDFARFGPSSYILAKQQNSDVRLLVIEHKKNKKRFKGVFVVAKDSPIEKLSQLKGKNFAFGNKNSTIGRYLSQAQLINIGIYAKSFKSFDYLGRHDKVALAVATGQYDAGVVKENTFKKYQDKLKKIADFPNITKPWVIRSQFDDKVFSCLQKALLKLTDKKILKTLKQDGFLTASDEEYNFVRVGMKTAEKFEDK